MNDFSFKGDYPWGNELNEPSFLASHDLFLKAFLGENNNILWIALVDFLFFLLVLCIIGSSWRSFVCCVLKNNSIFLNV